MNGDSKKLSQRWENTDLKSFQIWVSNASLNNMKKNCKKIICYLHPAGITSQKPANPRNIINSKIFQLGCLRSWLLVELLEGSKYPWIQLLLIQAVKWKTATRKRSRICHISNKNRNRLQEHLINSQTQPAIVFTRTTSIHHLKDSCLFAHSGKEVILIQKINGKKALVFF